MMLTMDTEKRSAIARVVERAGGPVALGRELGLHYQEVQRWVRRGWCSHLHVFRLRPWLPRGVRVEDLISERGRNG